MWVKYLAITTHIVNLQVNSIILFRHVTLGREVGEVVGINYKIKSKNVYGTPVVVNPSY